MTLLNIPKSDGTSYQAIVNFIGEHSRFSTYQSSEIPYRIPTNNLAANFPTTEHILQLAKHTSRQQATAIFRRTLQDYGTDPRAIKRSCMTLAEDTNRINPYWKDVSPILFQITFLKFYSSPTYRSLLLRNMDAVIINGNYWHDNFFGVCACDRCQRLQPPLNLLGQTLMAVRDLLRNQVASREYHSQLIEKDLTWFAQNQPEDLVLLPSGPIPSEPSYQDTINAYRDDRPPLDLSHIIENESMLPRSMFPPFTSSESEGDVPF